MIYSGATMIGSIITNLGIVDPDKVVDLSATKGAWHHN